LTKKNYIISRADFPKRSKNQLPVEFQSQNKISRKYNPEGVFPLVVVNDKKAGKASYQNVSPSDYIC
jgi:hypothetical protein